MKFKEHLKTVIYSNYYNNYGIDNFDSLRFGDYQEDSLYTFRETLKNKIKKHLHYRIKDNVENLVSSIAVYDKKLEFLYGKLEDKDKKLLVYIMAYRIMGFRKIKLPINNRKYWKLLRKANELADYHDFYDPNFLHFKLFKMDLKKINYPIKFYFSPLGVLIDFMLEQYAYKSSKKKVIQADEGDVVLDIGGCWGDTALYFAEKVGPTGQVYSFEFIPGNIKIHDLNVSLNPNHKDRIKLVKRPIYSKSNAKVYFEDSGPASKISFHSFNNQTGETETLSVDDFVSENNITKVDFIKMDIEGAERYALEGAIETIKKYTPKLAIALYHSLDDLVDIPKWIDDLKLGYKFYIGHYTIHAEETMLFATVDS
jgi:FkbM family methyltransferase